MCAQENTRSETLNQALDAASEMDGKYLTFWTDKQLFGIPIKDVVQIVGIQTITPIPQFPYYAKGIINLRGNIIPLIDVRLRLDKMEMEYTERTCIIVASIRGKAIGFIVDEVNEVTYIDEGDISLPPTVSEAYSSAFLTGIGRQKDGVILLMDAAKILSDEVVDALTDNAEGDVFLPE